MAFSGNKVSRGVWVCLACCLAAALLQTKDKGTVLAGNIRSTAMLGAVAGLLAGFLVVRQLTKRSGMQAVVRSVVNAAGS